MAEFSYDESIAPYASSLFQRVEANPFLTSARKSQLSDSLLGSLERAKERTDKGVERGLDVELARTRLDTQRLALEDARTELQLKRDAIEAAPLLDKEFEKILDSAEMSKGEKAAGISRLAMSNANAISRSPVLSDKYRFAMRAVEPDTSGGITPYQQISLERNFANDKRAEQRYQAEQQEKTAKQREADDKEERSRIDKVLGIQYDEDSYGVKKFKTPADKAIALDVIDRYAPAEFDKVSKLPDEELHNEALRIRRQLYSTKEPPKEENKAAALFPVK